MAILFILFLLSIILILYLYVIDDVEDDLKPEDEDNEKFKYLADYDKFEYCKCKGMI